MADLLPEDVLTSLEKGTLSPIYLFYGPDEFRMERALEKIRQLFIPESARDFNLEICYGGEVSPSEIINHAGTMPFMGRNRLIIVRRTDEFKTDQLNTFMHYLEDPSDLTCLIFISSRTDFKIKFYKKIRAMGLAVNFEELKDKQIVPWIKKTSAELGIKITGRACAKLQEIVGNRLRDLYSELLKLQIRYEDSEIGEDDVKEMAIYSRIYSVFELMNAISSRDQGKSLSILKRFLEEEDQKSAPLQIIGMLNRQLRLLWQTSSVIKRGGKSKDVSKKLGIAPYFVGEYMKQSKKWSDNDFEKGIYLLYQADRMIKSGSRPRPVIENLILSLCN